MFPIPKVAVVAPVAAQQNAVAPIVAPLIGIADDKEGGQEMGVAKQHPNPNPPAALRGRYNQELYANTLIKTNRAIFSFL